MRRISTVVPFVLLGLAGSGCAGRAEPAGTGTLGHASTPAAISTTPAAASTPAPVVTVTKTARPSASPTAPSRWPSPEDCVSYDPAHLAVHYEAGVFVVSDGATEVARLQGDPHSNVGEKGIALARRYREHCFLGRGNIEGDYVFDYWRSPTGAHTTIPDEEDACSPYDPTNLQLEDLGAGGGWRLKDHDHVLHLFADDSDARGGLLVASMYHEICFVGVITDTNLDQVSYFR
jgi:hypothetical protein